VGCPSLPLFPSLPKTESLTHTKFTLARLPSRTYDTDLVHCYLLAPPFCVLTPPVDAARTLSRRSTQLTMEWRSAQTGCRSTTYRPPATIANCHFPATLRVPYKAHVFTQALTHRPDWHMTSNLLTVHELTLLYVRRYSITSTVSNRVGRLNPSWQEDGKDADVCEHCFPAVQLPPPRASLFSLLEVLLQCSHVAAMWANAGVAGSGRHVRHRRVS